LYVDATPTIVGPLATAFQLFCFWFSDCVADIAIDEQITNIPAPTAAPKRTIIFLVS
jgi:hypothetical protein